MNPYYHVYRTDETRGPKVKHLTLEAAQTEAERLANQHPGGTFVILKAVAVVRCTVASTFWMDGEVPPEPIEPDVPKRRPPFNLPDGYDRWVSRGLGWRTDKANYCTWDTKTERWKGKCEGCSANGLEHYEYWEAVKDEPTYQALGWHDILQKGDQLLSNIHWIPAVDSIGKVLGTTEWPAARRPL